MHFETISLSEESLFPSETILGVQQTKDYSGGSLGLPAFSTEARRPLVIEASKGVSCWSVRLLNPKKAAGADRKRKRRPMFI